MAAKKNGIQPDEFCDDGKTRKLNRTRPFGIVYSAQLDELKGRPMPPEPAKFVQDGICYAGDGIPVGYVPAAERGEPVVIPPVEEVLADNERLQAQVNAQQAQIAELFQKLESLMSGAKPAGGTGAAPTKETAHGRGARPG